MQVSNNSSIFDLSSLSSQYSSAVASSTSTAATQSTSNDVSVSNIGQLLSAFSSMSEEDKTDADSFRDSILEAVESGEYDAEELAASAPDSLVALAEETGIDLEELVDEIASMAEQAPPPPPSGMMPPNSALSLTEDELEEADAYRESLIEAMESGEFDAETLAENAPDAVVAMAEEAGMTVEEFITQVAEGDENGNMPPPPPPSANSSATAALNMYTDIQSSANESTPANVLSQLFSS
ncbi:hypothetical protein [Marinomonas communis]|uniref:hypothetical protein n=1 Tax=Marinomonas communis TaxID=28254 RepID=UPI001D1822F1|nr:hypothetical protein [Marinomonas communis]MCC4274033.1 hypothetical protein [Marinomonas communis]MEC8080741.1 hypothetical protein [Pseudomonadota bacterium]